MGVQGLGFTVEGLGVGVSGRGFWVDRELGRRHSQLRVWGLNSVRAEGFGLTVSSGVDMRMRVGFTSPCVRGVLGLGFRA